MSSVGRSAGEEPGRIRRTSPHGVVVVAVEQAVTPQIPLSEIIRGVSPYIILEFARVMVMVAVPGIATWLPSVIVG